MVVFCLTCWAFMIPTAAILKSYPLNHSTRLAIWIIIGLFSMAFGAFIVDYIRAKSDPVKFKLTISLIAIVLLIWVITSATIQ